MPRDRADARHGPGAAGISPEAAADQQIVKGRASAGFSPIANGALDVRARAVHHLDLEHTWPKLFSLLKPGGRMSFAEPNMLNPQIYCERHFRRFFPQVSPDETAFVRSRLRRDLEKAGFTSLSIQPFDWLHPATPRVLIPTVSKVGKVLEMIWPIREFAGSLCIRAQRPEEGSPVGPAAAR